MFACAVQNQLVVFADDTHPRWLTAVAQLDYDTMAGTDKFGNMFVARLPADVSATIENDPSGAKVCGTGVLYPQSSVVLITQS